MYKKLFVARTKWQNIGLELKFNPCDLDAIKINNRENTDECFRELLSTWLKRGDPKPTWASLANALKSQTVGFGYLTEEVQVKHLLGESTTLECTDKPQPECSGSLQVEWSQSPQPKPKKDKRHNLEQFQCPCSKCDLITYLDQGCPKTKTCSYPYLPLNTLSEDDREDLIQKLSDDTANIIQCFADLLSNASESLKKRQVTVEQLIKVALDLGAYKSTRNQIPLLKEDEMKLSEATSIDAVFIILRKHMSFFNYEILSHIIRHLGDECDRRNLEEFCSRFKVYCERKVFEAPPSVFHSNEGEKRDRKQFVVVGTQDLFNTLNNVKEAQRKIASLLGLRVSTIQLKQIDCGCVILVFSIPGVLNVFPLKPATHAELKAYGYTIIVPDTSSNLTEIGACQDLSVSVID